MTQKHFRIHLPYFFGRIYCAFINNESVIGVQFSKHNSDNIESYFHFLSFYIENCAERERASEPEKSKQMKKIQNNCSVETKWRSLLFSMLYVFLWPISLHNIYYANALRHNFVVITAIDMAVPRLSPNYNCVQILN